MVHGIEGTEPAVAAAYANVEFCTGGGGVVGFGSMGFSGTLFWLAVSECLGLE